MANTNDSLIIAKHCSVPRNDVAPDMDEIDRVNSAASETETYYNGGVSDQSLKVWFERFFQNTWEHTTISPSRETSASPTEPMPDGKLCSRCALCCDGTLFSSVPVSDDERDRLGDGANFRLRGDRVMMQLKCSCLDRGSHCQVYVNRPKACRIFRCDLLNRADGSELSLSDSEYIVSEAKRLQLASIEAFARAMPSAFVDTNFISAVDARNHYAEGRGKGVQVNEHLRRNAWLQYDAFKDYIRANFLQDFSSD
jgi:uncharacterized protein